MNADGTDQRQLTRFVSEPFSPQFSRDGKFVYFAATVSGRGQLWKVSTEDGEAFFVEDNVILWRVSADGESLIFSTFDHEKRGIVTRVRDLETGEIEQTLNIEPETWMEASPDGRTIYFNTAEDNARDLWAIDRMGGKPVRITKFPSDKIFRFALSPDGRQLACIRQSITYDARMFHLDGLS